MNKKQAQYIANSLMSLDHIFVDWRVIKKYGDVWESEENGFHKQKGVNKD